jgi:ribonuclease R
VAGALRFELLSEGRTIQRGRRREHGGGATPSEAQAKAHPGRSPRRQDRKPGKAKAGKSKRGKSWKP